jgi:hypothetical protein
VKELAMRQIIRQRCLVALLCVSLGSAGYAPAAVAGLIGGQALLGGSTESTADLRISVQQRLVRLGVAPDLVKQRVYALGDAEVHQLDAMLDELPAGAGALEVIGIVFLVLLILELVGVTDIFKKI